jgi:hypothetical protein
VVAFEISMKDELISLFWVASPPPVFLHVHERSMNAHGHAKSAHKRALMEAYEHSRVLSESLSCQSVFQDFSLCTLMFSMFLDTKIMSVHDRS